jgi:DnaK suppressor protein
MSLSTAPTAPTSSLTVGLPDCRTLLEEQRRRQLADIDELSSDLLSPQPRNGVARVDDLHVASQLLAAAQQQLQETDDALARLHDNTYGSCERCHAAISPERLEILPAARYCVSCQARHASRRSP